MEARRVRLPGCSGEAGVPVWKTEFLSVAMLGRPRLAATRDGQFESFKWAAIELLRFAASLVGPDHGVVTVLLVSFDTVGTISFNSHGVPSHGSENQLHPPLYVSGPLAGCFFSDVLDSSPLRFG